jgi:tetratricopeptide (TPR) repeat protein
MQSHFSSQSLAEIFRDLYLSERTGILFLRHEDLERRIYFDRGLIQYAESTEPEDDLGQILVQDARLSDGALAEARKVVDDPSDLPLTLVNRGLLGKAALLGAARSLAERIVEFVFGWDGGAAEFTERDEIPEVLESDVLSTFRLILHGIDTMAEFDPMLDAMREFDNCLRVRRPAPIPLEMLTLSRTQGFVLSRVDGQTNFRDIISTLPTEEEEEASRFLFGLLIIGVVDYDPPLGDGPFRVANILRDHADRCALERMQEKTIQQSYSRMRTQNPHEVLGVTHSASRAAIERAYTEAKVLFARDRLLPRVREKFRTELGVIESRLVEAYLQLTKPVRSSRRSRPTEEASQGRDLNAADLLMRPELDKTRSRTEQDEASRVAELYYSKARKAMMSGDYYNAIQYGKLAISYNGDDARLYFMLADCQVRNPEARWQRMAEQNYTKATQLDPWNAQYWISLGRFYKKRGLSLRARRQFEEALKLVPEHEEATKELESLR